MKNRMPGLRGCSRQMGRLWGLLLLLYSAQASAQGVLIVVHPTQPVPLPRPIVVPAPSPPPLSYKIKELAMHAKIADQVAQVQVSQTFVNTGSQTIQAQFVFPLPYDGAIDRLTFMVDGKEYDAKLLEKKKAREIYEAYVRKNQDPALLEWIGTGMFQTSVFPIPAGAERKVIIKYSQLLRKDKQLTDFLFPLATAKYTSSPIEKVTLHASIESTEKIKTVYSPTHAVNVQRSDDQHAVVTLEQTNTVPSTDFRLFYDSDAGKLSANVISYRPDSNDEGYFLLLASPEIKREQETAQVKKTVVFVLDRSGSMSGKKIEQAKEAVKFVLNNLREGDLFNVVAYDSNVESWKPELQKYGDETRRQAVGFVDGIYAGGSTNIDGALSSALTQIKDTSQPNYVIFLTDGLPTHGETNEGKIVASTESKNTAKVRIVSFGVGYDVNSRLLDRISRENFGQSEYVRPNENIESSVSKLYSRMSSPVLTDVKVAIDIEGAGSESSSVNRLYPKEVWDLFAGEQIVIAGRYKKPGEGKVVMSGKVDGEEKKFDFPASFKEKSDDQSYAFVEKLWAMRRIGEIIDQLDLHGKNEELVKELVDLSTKHGILTPYTSFLADDQAKPGELADTRLNLQRARSSLERLDEAEGRAGLAQRAEKKSFQFAENLTPAQRAGEPLDAAGGARAAAGPAVPGASASAAAAGGRGFYGGARYRDIETDREVATEGVLNIGKDTLYRRGKTLIAANAKDVDFDKDDSKIKKIKRFSDEYFTLVKDNTPEENALLAQQREGDTLLVQLRGQAYSIE
jgi:Ca-activated chloride channel family protein